jgi:hypothetical protein
MTATAETRPFMLVYSTERARDDARKFGIERVEEAVELAIVDGKKSTRDAPGLPRLRRDQRYAYLSERVAAIVEKRPARLGVRRATWVVRVFEKRGAEA